MLHRSLLWTGDRKTDILRVHRRRRASRYLDIPKTLRGCGCSACCVTYPPFDATLLQIESLVLLWEWDVPKKKGR